MPAPDQPMRQRGTSTFFPGLDKAWLARLARETTARRLAAGENLWSTGQRADHFTLIDSGVIQIERMTPTGEGIVLGLFGAGESIGLPAVLQRGRYPSDATALTSDTNVLRIRAKPVLEALAESQPLTMALNRALLLHTSVLRAKIDIVTAGSVPRRLAALFLHLIARFGNETGEGSVRIELGLTREQISQFVSTRVETVSRVLSRWQKAGWLQSGRGQIEILRVDMLRRVLGN
ncbi:MAG TPA: Crp/Fnr family transcriptional regulator [Casimicrobiaceae bacterium]